MAGDYDGDGRADPAIFDNARATKAALSCGGKMIHQFGAANLLHISVPADHDGDVKTDLAIFDPVDVR